MGQSRYSPEFKDEAERQVLERGYLVREGASRIGVSAHSLYKCVKVAKTSKAENRDAKPVEIKHENLKLRAELRRVQEERDTLKKAVAYLARDPEQSICLSKLTDSNTGSPSCAECNGWPV
jgi:transposase